MRILALLMLASLLIAADRPHDPWVFRSILDGRSRMVTVALSDSLWVSYDPELCAPYRIWNGDVLFQGAVYADGLLNKSATPATRGDFYATQEASVAWQARRTNAELPTRAVFKGYRLSGADGTDGITLLYNIDLNGTLVRVEETPRVVDVAGSTRKGLSRSFVVSGLPAGTSLAVRLTAKGLAASFAASGAASLVERAGATWLEMRADGSSSLRTSF